MFFHLFPFKKRQLCLGKKFGNVTRTSTFVAIFTIIHWVKAAQLTEQILLTAASLMEGAAGAGSTRLIKCNKRASENINLKSRNNVGNFQINGYNIIVS